jgi:hypothetical protein
VILLQETNDASTPESFQKMIEDGGVFGARSQS